MKKLDLPQNILSAWSAIEVLTPQFFRKPEDLCTGNRSECTYITKEVNFSVEDKPKPPYDKKDSNGKNHWIPFYHLGIGTLELEIVNNLLISFLISFSEKVSLKAKSSTALSCLLS